MLSMRCITPYTVSHWMTVYALIFFTPTMADARARSDLCDGGYAIKIGKDLYGRFLTRSSLDTKAGSFVQIVVPDLVLGWHHQIQFMEEWRGCVPWGLLCRLRFIYTSARWRTCKKRRDEDLNVSEYGVGVEMSRHVESYYASVTGFGCGRTLCAVRFPGKSRYRRKRLYLTRTGSSTRARVWGSPGCKER